MVIWTEPARDDLRQIYNFIARDSHYYAEQVVTTIIEKAEPLDSFPAMGRIVPELMEENVRELLVYSYRVIYEIVEGTAVIHAIIHARREFTDAMMGRIP